MLSSMLGDVALPAAQLLMRKVKKTTVSKTSEDCPAGRCTERLQHISVCIVLNSNITDEVSGMQMHMVAMCESYYNLCLRPISLLQMQPVRLAARIRLILCQISSTHQTETRGSQGELRRTRYDSRQLHTAVLELRKREARRDRSAALC